MLRASKQLAQLALKLMFKAKLSACDSDEWALFWASLSTLNSNRAKRSSAQSICAADEFLICLILF